MPLDVQAVRGILPRGGTILGNGPGPIRWARARRRGGRSGLERIKDRPRHPSASTRWLAIGGEEQNPGRGRTGCTSRA